MSTVSGRCTSYPYIVERSEYECIHSTPILISVAIYDCFPRDYVADTLFILKFILAVCSVHAASKRTMYMQGSS